MCVLAHCVRAMCVCMWEGGCVCVCGWGVGDAMGRGWVWKVDRLWEFDSPESVALMS